MQQHPPHKQPLRVGLLGFGIVGSGTHDVLTANRATITARAGRAIDIMMVATRTTARAKSIVGPSIEVLQDPMQLVRHPSIDVVVEAMGGTTVARDCVLAAIAHRKHVVTANKALLALHGEEIFAAASERGVSVWFEGAVAVSIPIVKALREGLVANRIEWVAGIVNGTSNHVLTRMRDTGCRYEEALAEAQELGYAEADPALDVDGGDAAHKLSLLAAMAFGGSPRFHDVHVEGIRALQPADFTNAARLGHTIKLLAVARRTGEGLQQLRVHPAFTPNDALLARVDGRMNGIVVKGNASGVTMYYGAGAGSRETASAVVADLVDIARALGQGGQPCVPSLGFHHEEDVPRDVQSVNALCLRQYLRVPLGDAGGADEVIGVLGDYGVEVAERVEGEGDVALLTHETPEWRVAGAVEAIGKMPGVREGAVRLRVEEFA